MLEMHNVSKSFYRGTINERKALDNIDLKVNKGDFITIIGSNGAGKSTLFNCISGNILPDSGRVFLGGKDVTYEKEYVRAKEIGRLFQDPLKGTAPHMTIEENLALAYLRADFGKRTFSRITKADREFFYQKVKTLDLGLEERLDQAVGSLSGGQRQALTLLMATSVPPKLLLLDEHTAALDPATAEKIMALTEKIVKEQETTCLMITHNLSQAISVGNRTLMMEHGRIALDLDEKTRKGLKVEDLLRMFKEKTGRILDNDRMLLEE